MGFKDTKSEMTQGLNVAREESQHLKPLSVFMLTGASITKHHIQKRASKQQKVLLLEVRSQSSSC